MSDAIAPEVESDMLDVIWGDPPPTGKYGALLERYVNALKTRPGEWGELPAQDGEYYPLSVGTSLRKAYPDVEYTSRTTDSPNRVRIWARWIESDPEAEALRTRRPVGVPNNKRK